MYYYMYIHKKQMLTQVNYEVKGTLAKLLATEDLIIENRKVPTAAFDVEKRVLTLPMWEKASGTVYDLLVGHEVGHALYTPPYNWMKDYPGLPMSVVNVFEDVRIERLMKQKYPGLSKTFYSGYSQLSEQDFFELRDEDIDDMSLADRINLHYKIGNFVDISFGEDEKIFVDRAFKTNSFEDVLQLAREVTDFIENDLQRTEIDVKFGDEYVPFDSTDGDGLPEEEEDYGDLEDESEGRGTEESTEDTEFKGDVGNVGGQHNEIEAVTDKTLKENLKNLNDNKDKGSYYDPEYITIPTLNLDTLVTKNSEIHEYLDDWWIEVQDNFNNHSERPHNIFQYADDEYRLFRRSAQKEVNYLVKEFEMRKSADAYARATVAKTGVIDCNKLHSYRYNEDIFRKVTTIPDGKNHGLIFILDWSGSMSHVLKDTIKQLFNLVWFCKKVQIPFQVFAFTNEWRRLRSYEEPSGQVGEHHEVADGRIQIDGQFSMLEFLSSDCKRGDLEHQMNNLWRLTLSLTHQRSYSFNDLHMVIKYQYPSRLQLSGTPLNEALVSLNQLIPEFQKRTGVQKIQCITLTDGEAHPLRYSRMIKARYEGGEDYLGARSAMNGASYIRDITNGKTYYCKSEYHELTSALLSQLRGRFPKVNFIGIRVMERRDANHFIRKYMDWDFDRIQGLQNQWRKTKYVKLTDVGYHAYFGMSSSNLNVDDSFEVKEDATKSQIKSAFKKSLTGKKMNKKILSEFMELIA